MKVYVLAVLMLGFCLLSVNCQGRGKGTGKKEKEKEKKDEKADRRPNKGNNSKGRPGPFGASAGGLNGFRLSADLFNVEGENHKGNGDREKSPSLPLEAVSSSWNRSLDGQAVAESGWSLNTSVMPLALIRSSDRLLKDVNFTGAITLYLFGENETIVVVKPGFRRASSMCLILPSENITLRAFEEELAARNGTELTAPPPVLQLNATGAVIGFGGMLALYEQYPPLYFLCGFGQLYNVTAADNATFPVVDAADPERVVKMMTLDRELDVLVPKKSENGRNRGNERGSNAGEQSRGKGQGRGKDKGRS